LVTTAGSPQAFEDDDCSLPDEEDEDLAPEEENEDLTLEVLLHVAYEVVSKLDRVEEFRSLSLEEQSLRDFLVEQICSLRLVIEAKDCPAAVGQSSHAPPPLVGKWWACGHFV
jgi:hypothetical protein